MYLDGHGVHHFIHHDAAHNKDDKVVIYADGVAPKTVVTFLNAPKYKEGQNRYYGKGLSLELSSNDGMSGLQQVFHSLNGENYKPYSGTIAVQTEGKKEYRYYAVDKVGNDETTVEHVFTVDLSAPETYHNVVGIASGNIISSNTKIYLTHEDNLSGVAKTYYQIDDGPERTYTKGAIPLDIPDGDHTLTYYSIDRVQNREAVKSFTFYLDKTAPIMSADVLGDKFIVGDQVYFSGRTKLKLTAVDNKSGVKEVIYSIDGGSYKTYEDPFYLPGKAGIHTIRYYATDQMSNEGAGSSDSQYEEYKHTVSTVYVDLTGPKLSHTFSGPTFQKGDTLFLGANTNLQLKAYDPESGLQYISYKVDKEANENRYDKPFTIPGSGYHRIDYFGYDNVNNRNVNTFNVMVDRNNPEIIYTYSTAAIDTDKGGIPVYPSYVTLFLASTDNETGAGKVFYKVNDGKEKPYTQPIEGFNQNKKYRITIRVQDKLGNEEIKNLYFKTAKY